MIRVKICGITDLDGIGHVNACLPDYIGFVFAESRRRVDAAAAARLTERLDGRIKKAGVFVNMPLKAVAEIVSACGLDVIQLHGDEEPDYIPRLRELTGQGTEIWKAVRVRDSLAIRDTMDSAAADRFLLDAYVEGAYGGAGKSFDWSLAEAAAQKGSIILAGGLTPENVERAARQVRPFAVDTSSGVETGGRKDGEKIREFIRAVRSVEPMKPITDEAG